MTDQTEPWARFHQRVAALARDLDALEQAVPHDRAKEARQVAFYLGVLYTLAGQLLEAAQRDEPTP